MKVEQIYTGCIAHAAYYIENNGEAAIFDPLREVQPYIDRAAADGAKIKYVFETHFHADFVSGHLDLKKKSGAEIVFGPTAKPGYEAMVAEDGQVFNVGNYTIKVLHTPGHTMESTTYLLKDKDGKDHCIFSGDTLFLGDVGRPDLAQKAATMTQEELAGILFDSLRTKIMPLADDVALQNMLKTQVPEASSSDLSSRAGYYQIFIEVMVVKLLQLGQTNIGITRETIAAHSLVARLPVRPVRDSI
jgi:glyoxylase-like metal-dependent hydrolase (beta-lactamase superfamily II)